MPTTPGKDAQYRKEKRGRGECGWSGCKAVTGDDNYYCPAHRAAHASRMRRARLGKAQEAA